MEEMLSEKVFLIKLKLRPEDYKKACKGKYEDIIVKKE